MRNVLLLTLAVFTLAVAACGPTGSTQKLSSPPPGGREANESGGRTPPPAENTGAAKPTTK
ncbi:MAG: hypothetical protein MUF18_17235 [Fimbriiglobus sp.]|jgi:hypothetical protein|nr:hypothetical protein [Fimbriiglobus sp.]